jgi:hypothetical protein
MESGYGSATSVKGTVSRNFLLQVFFMNRIPPSPFRFFRQFAEIFASQGAPPVSMALPANSGNHIRLLTPESKIKKYKKIIYKLKVPSHQIRLA